MPCAMVPLKPNELNRQCDADHSSMASTAISASISNHGNVIIEYKCVLSLDIRNLKGSIHTLRQTGSAVCLLQSRTVLEAREQELLDLLLRQMAPSGPCLISETQIVLILRSGLKQQHQPTRLPLAVLNFSSRACLSRIPKRRARTVGFESLRNIGEAWHRLDQSLLR